MLHRSQQNTMEKSNFTGDFSEFRITFFDELAGIGDAAWTLCAVWLTAFFRCADCFVFRPSSFRDPSQELFSGLQCAASGSTFADCTVRCSWSPCFLPDSQTSRWLRGNFLYVGEPKQYPKEKGVKNGLHMSGWLRSKKVLLWLATPLFSKSAPPSGENNAVWTRQGF